MEQAQAKARKAFPAAQKPVQWHLGRCPPRLWKGAAGPPLEPATCSPRPVGFPLWSGGFCKEPKHPRRMVWQKGGPEGALRASKAQAVQRVIESGRPLSDIAAELDVSPGQLSQWRNEQLAAGSAEALAQKKADEAEMLRLRREVKRLEDENLILRKAAAFFAKGIA